MARVDEAAVGRVFREESGRSIAAPARAFGDINDRQLGGVTELRVLASQWESIATWPGCAATRSSQARMCG
jgi:hypothetical protein